MAIPQIPKQHRDNIKPISKEEAAESFLNEIESKSKPKSDPKAKISMPVYFKPDIKDRMTRAAEDMEISQTAWVNLAVKEKLARDGY